MSNINAQNITVTNLTVTNINGHHATSYGASCSYNPCYIPDDYYDCLKILYFIYNNKIDN